MAVSPKFKKLIIVLVVYLIGLFTPVIVDAALSPLGVLFLAVNRPTHEEIARATSPDNRVDAVIVRINPGAFSSYHYEVFVIPKGAAPSGSPVIEGTKFDGEQLQWTEPHLLNVRYTRARIRHFGNLWYSNDVGNGAYYVEIRLSQTSNGFAYLGPGGNL